MNKKDLEVYIDLVINEEHDKANALMAKIMSEETKKCYRDMLIEDGDLEISPETVEISDTDVEPAEVEVEDDTTDSEGDTESDVKSKINYQFNDIEKDIARLRSMFGEINADEETDVENALDGDEEVNVDVEEDGEASPLTYANDGEDIFSDSDNVTESLELSPVKVDGTTSKEVGAGSFVKVDDQSPIGKNTRDKKGSPASSKAENDANGSGKLEKAPDVKPTNIKSTNVLDLEKVSDKGDESAELNSKEGFGNEDEDSPLSKIKN